MAMITATVQRPAAPQKDMSIAESLLMRLRRIDDRLAAHGNTLSDAESAIVGGSAPLSEAQENPASSGFLGQLEQIVSRIEMRFDPIETSINRVRTAF